MEEINPEKEGMKEAKKYTSLSTRLPYTDAVLFSMFCKRLGTNTSERLRQLVIYDLKKPIKQTSAGINKIKYDKVHNSFSWFVLLDSGREIKVLDNLSLEFLKNFQNEIQEAIKERNDWVHQTNSDSVDIPREIIGEKKDE
ncbi:hypothetical protein HYW76_02000 [Candidatus Pacearchaeota archaeon]|nr:hypothetical protein [Candidatus Pacearchaeota archaeon]